MQSNFNFYIVVACVCGANDVYLGKEFHVPMPTQRTSGELTIFNPQTFSVEVNIVYEASNPYYRTYTTNLPAHSKMMKAVQSAIGAEGTTTYARYIRITSTANIYVWFDLGTFASRSDMTSLLPDTSLGETYLPFTSYCVGNYILLIMCFAGNTSLGIHLPASKSSYLMVTNNNINYYGGEQITLSTQGVEVVRIESGYSFSGTFIGADQQIGVYSGCDSTSIVKDLAFAQVPPINEAGRQYILFPNNPMDVVVFGTTESNNKVLINDGDTCQEVFLNNMGDVFRRTIIQPIEILSTHPVVVAQFVPYTTITTGISNFYVTPVEKYFNEMTFYIPENVNTSHIIVYTGEYITNSDIIKVDGLVPTALTDKTHSLGNITITRIDGLLHGVRTISGSKPFGGQFIATRGSSSLTYTIGASDANIKLVSINWHTLNMAGLKSQIQRYLLARY